MDDTTRVVHGDVAQDADGTSLGINLHLGEVGGEGIDDVCPAAGTKTGLADYDSILVATDHVAKWNSDLRRIHNRHEAVRQFELVWLHLEQSRRGFENVAFGILCRLERCEAGCERCGAACSPVCEWSGGSISESALNFVKTYSQRFGDNLGKNGPRALADLSDTH